MGKVKKTNAMRILESEKISYEIKTYKTKDGRNDGISVAKKVKEDVDRVFKTIVVKGESNQLYVAVLPSDEKLSLKKLAALKNEKSVDLLPVKKLRSKTGYIKGGCSPIAMKNEYPTIYNKSILDKDYILVNAGKLGILIKLKSKKLIDVTQGMVFDIIQ